MKDLPVKYYLTHYKEFLDFIRGPCQHLLDEKDWEFVQTFDSLEEDAQCVLVRSAHRKYPIFKSVSLYYEELQQVSRHIDMLLELGLFRRLLHGDLSEAFELFTKPELCQLLDSAQIEHKTSHKKEQLVEIARSHIEMKDIENNDLFENYLVREFDNQLAYFLYLFFGRLSGKLNMFSMRDMGIMRTRKGEQSDIARFDTLEQAKTAFFYRQKSWLAKSLPPEKASEELAQISTFPAAIGPQAERARDMYYFRLGNALLPLDQQKALLAWSRSQHHEAQERWIREKYKQGEIEGVLQRLEQIIADPDSEHLLVFAEDFLARKYNKKRTSILTDMLREGSRHLQIDEIYRDGVELGVKHYYENQGCIAFRTENRLWQSLFGLAFWSELHETDQSALATEFDVRPRALVDNTFYALFSPQIEKRLAGFNSAKELIKHLTKMAASHYGKTNGLFHWHPKMLEILSTFANAAPSEAIQNILRAMAKDYRNLSDGFPDIMVVEQNKLRFEEIKAPGDSLRKNQLISIRQLRQAGFDVSVTQVEWFIDPTQAYVVIDVETTGGKADQHRITEIGMVKIVDGEVVDSWQSLINPQRHISRFITDLTGISNDMVADAPLFTDVADKLTEFLQGSVFVAHNVNFDYGFFKKEFERVGLHFKMPKLCTVREMKKAVPGLPSYSLANLSKHFDIQMTQHHRALSDAQAAAELLNIINQHRMTHSPRTKS